MAKTKTVSKDKSAPISLDKILTDRELRRIFGYEPHDQVGTLNSEIKEAIERALNCRLSFYSVSGTQQEIKFQSFNIGHGDTGKTKRRLLEVIYQLQSYAKQRKPSDADVQNLQAELEKKWSNELHLKKTQILQISLGRPSKSSDKIYLFRDKRDIGVSITNADDIVVNILSDADLRRIRQDAFGSLEALQAEITLRPLNLDDARKIIIQKQLGATRPVALKTNLTVNNPPFSKY